MGNLYANAGQPRSINLVERPGIGFTALPDLVDGLFSSHRVSGTIWVLLNGQDGSSANAVLMLLRKRIKPSPDLSRPLAISAQIRRSNLAARMMPQVLPIHFELDVIVHVNHLMHQRIFHMALAPKPILAQQDALFGAEPPRASHVARLTVDVVGGQVAAGLLQVFEHERDCGTVFHQIRLPLFASHPHGLFSLDVLGGFPSSVVVRRQPHARDPRDALSPSIKRLEVLVLRVWCRRGRRWRVTRGRHVGGKVSALVARLNIERGSGNDGRCLPGYQLPMTVCALLPLKLQDKHGRGHT